MCSYVENPLNRGLHILFLSFSSFLLPLSPVYSILFISVGPLTANSFPPTFLLFLRYSSPAFRSRFTHFSPHRPSSIGMYVCMCFLLFFILFSFSPSLCLSSYFSSSFLETEINSIARQSSFLQLPKQNLENVSRTLSGRMGGGIDHR